MQKNQICRINFDKDRGGKIVKNQHWVGIQLKFFFRLNRLKNLQGVLTISEPKE